MDYIRPIPLRRFQFLSNLRGAFHGCLCINHYYIIITVIHNASKEKEGKADALFLICEGSVRLPIQPSGFLQCGGRNKAAEAYCLPLCRFRDFLFFVFRVVGDDCLAHNCCEFAPAESYRFALHMHDASTVSGQP
jgi:hypothetical protein